MRARVELVLSKVQIYRRFQVMSLEAVYYFE